MAKQKTETLAEFQARLRKEAREKNSENTKKLALEIDRQRRILSNDLMQALLADEAEEEDRHYARDMGVDDPVYQGPADMGWPGDPL